MTGYGIKLVWAGWNNDPVIGFSNQGYKRWRDHLPPGTRMLLYETATKAPGFTGTSTRSIIAEVEVTGSFEDGERLRAPDEQHDRLLPVKVIVGRDQGRPVPLARVRELIADPKWPRMGESWKPITREQYDAIVRERG